MKKAFDEIILINYTGRRGGGPVDAIETAKALVAKGYKVAAVISRDVENYDEWLKVPLYRLIVVPTYNNKFEFVYRTLLFKFFTRKQIRKELKNEKIRVVFCPMLTFWTGMINEMIDCDNIIVGIHDPMPHSGDKYAKYNVIFDPDRLCMQAKRIIVHSAKFVEYVEKKYNKYGKVIYLPLGRYSYYDKLEGPEWVKYDPDKTNYVFFGTVSKYKGIGVLLDAYRIVQDSDNKVSLSIFGAGDFSEYEEKLEGLRNVRLENRWIDENEVKGIFTGHDLVMICPYIDATQSGAALVAMEFGVPVIATDVGGLSEQIENEKNGLLVQPDNAEELAYAMLRIAQDDSLRDFITENTKEYLRSISWDSITDRFIDIVDSVC